MVGGGGGLGSARGVSKGWVGTEVDVVVEGEGVGAKSRVHATPSTYWRRHQEI